MKEKALRELTSLTIVVPVYNEEGCLTPLYEQLAKVASKLTSHYEILLKSFADRRGRSKL